MRQDVERGVVVEARMLSIVKELPQTDDFGLDFDTGGWADLRLETVKSLVGHPPGRTFVARMKVSAFPGKGNHFYAVGTKSADGTVLVEHWNWLSKGLCVDRELAKSLGIEAAVFQLRNERIVKTDPGCDAEWEE